MEQTNLYSFTIPPIMQMLENLSLMLEKAASHADTKGSERRPGKVHAEALLNERLVFDQFPLKQQIQIACDNAKGGAACLAGIEPPKFEDTENSVEELKERITKTLEFLKSIRPEQVIGREEEKAMLPYFADKYLTCFEYASQYLMPNFYFHVVTAYAIMRKNGIDIGKGDYLRNLPWKNL